MTRFNFISKSLQFLSIPAKKAWLIIFIVYSSIVSYGQQNDSVKVDATDSIDSYLSTYRKQIEEAEKKNISEFKDSQAGIKQDEILEKILKTNDKIKSFLKSGIDTTGIVEDLNDLDRLHRIAGDGVFTNTGTSQTHRNLATSAIIISELYNKALARKVSLDKYYKSLTGFRNEIDSLASQPLIYQLPKDSADLLHYEKKLQTITIELTPNINLLNSTLNSVRNLQIRVNRSVIRYSSDLNEIENFRKNISSSSLNREMPDLWASVAFARPFSEIITYSAVKGMLAFKFYALANVDKIAVLILLVITVYIFLKSLKTKLLSEGISEKDVADKLVLHHPLLSALIIVISLFQFVFPNPPFLFKALLWITTALSLTVLFRKFISKYWLYSWLAIFFLFLLACADNSILQASRVERWMMLLLALCGIIVCSVILLKGHRNELKEKSILYFIAFVICLESLSLILNMFGRYNMSKTLGNSGYFNVVIGVSFLWTIRLINEALSLASQAYKGPEGKSFYINFKRVGDKAPLILYVFLIIGWFILFGRNFYSFRLITEPLHDFLFQERMIGNTSYTIKSILVFFGIIILSTGVSKVVSFFAADKDFDNASHNPLKKEIGSWLLLIRIGILSTGLFLAFAAAGIPMDRITIIIGALGVGIGFGLQTLVNNLVSGLIISFEKPVSVGDIVEIGGKSGTMTSIGFRSSIISTWEGSDMIIPNGDLLNQHLINWTLGSNSRRVDIPIGVAYGTDLGKAKQVLTDVLLAEHRIMSHPQPAVILLDFNSSSVDFKLFFWVRHFNDWLAVKSDIIQAIDFAFRENNIEIPFPQQDIYIKEKTKTRKTNKIKERSGNDLKKEL
ncbi:mechanosensitive ion channel [Pedobacter sp. HMF7647]|uniref:Mechanosensitive ion channel n=1 Tax=Hufsiella arboris TaxID=2695275 RepID=A0A7K1Y7D5_9SPHI|nr:mechanosensitive ion channel domain-containing protein [Hufsiella arboris]MXV50484.1 mechanosensitive ion channel [Hufsiella arboris]